MQRRTSLKTLAFIACAAIGSLASAQTVERIQLQYPQNLPEVQLDGTSPFLWDNPIADATVAGDLISITVHSPGIGFSLVAPWSVAVQLPVLPVSAAIYRINVSLVTPNDPHIEQIGFVKAWVFESRKPSDVIFQSTFDGPQQKAAR